MAAPAWNYEDTQFWKTVKQWQCNGTRQSPINIDTSAVVASCDLPNLSLTNFDKAVTGEFFNNGHSIQFEPNAGSPDALFVNHCGTYKLAQFHFHWGACNGEGSEHRVNGVQYDGELHFVTKKTAGPPDAGDAVAVLGVLLNSKCDESISGTWSQLNAGLPQNYNDSNKIGNVTYSDLLPCDLSYYHYEGSLTTPNCGEIVQWFNLKTPVDVPASFLKAIRSGIRDEHGAILTRNFRELQPLNGRKVMIPDSGPEVPGH